VFVDHASYQRVGGLYADAFGVYGDNQFRYALLCLAGLEAPLHLGLAGRPYGQDCVFIANDWHASLVPVYLAAKYRPAGVYADARSVLAIHNLRHQGVFPPGSYAALGLPGGWYGALEWQYPPHMRQGSYEEEGRAVNTLKARAAPPPGPPSRAAGGAVMSVLRAGFCAAVRAQPGRCRVRAPTGISSVQSCTRRSQP